MSSLNLINLIIMIIGIVIDAIAVLAVALGAIFGVKKGGAKKGWSLFWRIISIVASMGITVALGSTLSTLLASVSDSIISKVIPESIATYLSGSTIPAGVLLAVVLPFAFLIIFLIVSLLLLIPDKLIWNKVVAPAIAAKTKEKPFNKTASGVLGGVLGAVCALLLFFAILMPFACTAVEGSEVLEKAKTAGLTSVTVSGLNNPVYVACDAVMGSTIYKPMASVSTAYGRAAIFDEAGYALDIYKNIQKEDDYEKAVNRSNRAFEKSKMLPDILADIILNVANDKNDSLSGIKGLESVINEDTLETIKETYENVKKKDMRNDANALFSTFMRMKASGLLSAKNSAARNNALDILLDDDSLDGICDDIYSSKRIVILVECFSNSIYNQYMDKLLGGADIEYQHSPFNLRDLSKKEARAEIVNITSAINNISNFSSSLTKYNNELNAGNSVSVNDIDLKSLGAALDTMKNSSVMSSCYEDILNVAKNNMSNRGSYSGIDISGIIDSVQNAESSESYLCSTQAIAGLGETFSDESLDSETRTAKIEENIDNLIENIDTATAKQIGEDLASTLNLENNAKAVEFITEYAMQLAEEKEENKDNVEAVAQENAAKDAVAINAVYSLLESSNEGKHDVPQDELQEYVKDIANSDMITQTMGEFAAQGETLGLAESITQQDKDTIIQTLNETEAPAENIQAILDFLNLN